MLLIGTLIVLALWVTFVWSVDPNGLRRRGKEPASRAGRTNERRRAFDVRPSAAMTWMSRSANTNIHQGSARAVPNIGRRSCGAAI